MGEARKEERRSRREGESKKKKKKMLLGYISLTRAKTRVYATSRKVEITILNCKISSCSIKFPEEKILCFDLNDLGRICLSQRRISWRDELGFLQQLQAHICRPKLQVKVEWLKQGTKLNLEANWSKIEPCWTNLSVRTSWRDDLVLGGGIGLVFGSWLSRLKQILQEEKIFSMFSPWRGFSLAWSLISVSTIFTIFFLIIVWWRRSNKENIWR